MNALSPFLKIATAIALVTTFLMGFAAGYVVFHPVQEQRVQITSQAILMALRERGFLVTETYLFNEPVTISKSAGSALKDFFFGQTITARGVMEVNLGIDLSKIAAKDIIVEGERVTIAIPPATLFNVRLVGPLDLTNQQGILKRLVQNDPGYNEGQAELTRLAEEQATKPELIERAQLAGKEEITRLVSYIAQGKTVMVK